MEVSYIVSLNLLIKIFPIQHTFYDNALVRKSAVEVCATQSVSKYKVERNLYQYRTIHDVTAGFGMV